MTDAWRRDLEDGLCDMLTVDELRSLLQTISGTEFLKDLPEGPVTPRRFVSEVVALLLRSGALDQKFFAELHAVRPRRAADVERIRRAVEQGLSAAALASGVNADEERFCASVTELNRTIERLTDDQRAALQHLRGLHRVAIPGCAGSGKTLVAVEQAARLSYAGLRVLLLCNSPNLAIYIRRLLGGSQVEVEPFGHWVADIAGSRSPKTWAVDYEPPDVVLEDCLQRLERRETDLYDAIVVDEGQDFPFEWWVIVDAALVGAHSGLLYIFHDDNQALVPFRAEYHVSKWDGSLSKNCRNAGAVFNLVARLHPSPPEEDPGLTGRGNLHVWPVRLEGHGSACPGQDCDLFASQFAPFLASTVMRRGLRRTVLLLSDSSPEWRCLTRRTNVLVPAPNWLTFFNREVVEAGLEIQSLSWKVHPKIEEIRRIRELPSVGPQPTAAQVRAVQTICKDMLRGFRTSVSSAAWNSIDGALHWNSSGSVRGPKFSHSDGESRVLAATLFLSGPGWVNGYPPDQTIRLAVGESTLDEPLSVHRIGEYKGLEADAVVLVWDRTMTRNELYVGASRAVHTLVLAGPSQAFGSLIPGGWPGDGFGGGA